ncbi:MAG: ankyrin repeat domain-containing protein [Faunusvirus sp.]|jgi:ankyrin repeat protein|uniref:Ankyrin repeat domain-containing protein n=1 Tax=Faunusvirus sp. TaxID=2487766 RepID=A0A3G4ZXR1_9VIRU|nr:MAG: ankyrin repeat domain-containing protein [Faunusvirus sp.]
MNILNDSIKYIYNKVIPDLYIEIAGTFNDLVRKDTVDECIRHINYYPQYYNNYYRNKKNDETGFNPLVIACIWNRIDVVTALLDKKIYLNAQWGFNGKTALHIACHDGNTNIAFKLIHAGADVNIVDEFNYTPLHCCCSYNTSHSETENIAIELIQHGANFYNYINNSNLDKYLHLQLKLDKCPKVRQHIYDKYRTGLISVINDTNDNPLKLSFRTTYAVDLMNIICDFIL